MKVGVVDYDAGNLTSVETALRASGANFVVSPDPDTLASCDRLVFPGVGDAGSAMDVLRERGLDQMLRDYSGSGKLILGICLGAQIVLDFSEESDTRCLGLIPGRAVRFPSDAGVKIPHMGWNTVDPVQPHPLFEQVEGDASFYFVHSYYPEPEHEQSVLSRTHYAGLDFASAIQRENIWAVQFHPEKSGRSGLAMLQSFLSVRD
ncbi:MAG: imidazole glycerol phosphate synthase subunit HisH [Spirochaetota bacterium]